jgi:hypothetical protein
MICTWKAIELKGRRSPSSVDVTICSCNHAFNLSLHYRDYILIIVFKTIWYEEAVTYIPNNRAKYIDSNMITYIHYNGVTY